MAVAASPFSEKTDGVVEQMKELGNVLERRLAGVRG
jgi:hypothetical protein